MRQLVDAEFEREAEANQLRFTCEHCAHFDPVSERCVHGFPNDVHRLAYYAARPDHVVFCKDFDLI